MWIWFPFLKEDFSICSKFDRDCCKVYICTAVMCIRLCNCCVINRSGKKVQNLCDLVGFITWIKRESSLSTAGYDEEIVYTLISHKKRKTPQKVLRNFNWKSKTFIADIVLCQTWCGYSTLVHAYILITIGKILFFPH